LTTGYGYFVLKLRLAPAGEPSGCAGMIERLGTADRRNFENAEELLRLLSAWASDAPKMS
jgi:hypothetical protein